MSARRAVLIPLDGSAPAEAILPHVLRTARALQLDAVLLCVLVEITSTAADRTLHLIVEARERLRQEAENYLRGVARHLADHGVRATTEVRVGDAATEIVAAAKEFDVQLIAMTTHGHRGLGRLIFSSTTDAVLRSVEIPALLVCSRESKREARAAETNEGDGAMSPTLRELLLGARTRFDVIEHPPAYTAQQRAANAHVGGSRVAKVVMVRADDWWGMVALPAPAKLDLHALEPLTDRTRLRLAAEDEFRHLFPDCEPGAMPPFGHLYGIDLFVDRDLADEEEIVFPAGRHEAEVRMNMRDYIDLARPTIAPLSRVSRAA
ncbi:MAG: universal stress protein [Candidatus Rokubacteria bacterium]|nr:universal stress protein [Candidatus Rokubacteria bacterium]